MRLDHIISRLLSQDNPYCLQGFSWFSSPIQAPEKTPDPIHRIQGRKEELCGRCAMFCRDKGSILILIFSEDSAGCYAVVPTPDLCSLSLPTSPTLAVWTRHTLGWRPSVSISQLIPEQGNGDSLVFPNTLSFPSTCQHSVSDHSLFLRGTIQEEPMTFQIASHPSRSRQAHLLFLSSFEYSQHLTSRTLKLPFITTAWELLSIQAETLCFLEERLCCVHFWLVFVLCQTML